MTFGLVTATAAPSLSVELSTIVAIAAAVIILLLALLNYMVALTM